MLFLYEIAPTKAENTAAPFLVEDIEEEVNELKRKGIAFEEYDMPGLKIKGGIATVGQDASAWFKDSEGNILAVTQLAAQPERERREAQARVPSTAR